MVDKAYDAAPHAKWYVFIETDIYVFWDSLFRSLDRLDSNERHYLGSPAAGANDVWFAYGGAGIVLSSRLVRELLQDGRQTISIKYEQMAKHDYCGDAVLAYVICKELGVRVGSVFPTMLGDDLLALHMNERKYCAPLATLHRVRAAQMEALWNWERCRPFTIAPITYLSMLDYALTSSANDFGVAFGWDNGAGNGTEIGSCDSGISCADICAQDPTCMQWSYRKWGCHTAEYVALGKSADDARVSGWAMARLKQLGYENDPSIPTVCRETLWPIPKIKSPGQR